MTNEDDHEPQKPPEKLGTAGQTLWDEVVEECELRPDELRLLASACRMGDHIQAMEKALEGQDLIVLGSMKQPVANPLLAEIRQYRAQQASLLGKLNLLDPDDDEEDDNPTKQGPMTRSESARVAANVRHHGNPQGKRKK